MLLIPMVAALASCEKFLDQQPISDLSSDKFWLTPGDAELGMAGIYSGVQDVFNTGYIEWGDARSDNFTYSGTGDAQINNSINAVTTTMGETNWSNFYKVIGRANLAIKHLPEITELGAEERDHYLAQAYALRAYMYFFLVKLWGDAPLWLEPYGDIAQDANLERTPAAEVLQQVVIPDLNKAADLINPDAENVWEVNLGGILAMQTDVYMWIKDYEQALAASARLIQLERYQLAPAEAWKSLFLQPSTDNGNIWSLNRIYLQDGPESITRRISSANLSPQYVMDPSVYEQFESNPNDIRAKQTYDSLLFANQAGNPNSLNKRLGKYHEMNPDGSFIYPNTTESESKLPLYRLADILLLRAEAFNMTGNKPEAFVLLNQVRERAGLDPLNEADYASPRDVETAILEERQLELFAECKRWFDLVRTGRVIEVMDPIIQERRAQLGMTPEGFGDERKILLPLHRTVLTNNPALVQNPPYSN